MTDYRSLERRLAALENDGTEELEIIMRDEVVETPWEPDGGSAPVPGVTETRYYRDKRGEWMGGG